MRVVVPPVLVDDRICRIIAAIESLLEVEEWVGAWWEPSTIPLTQVSGAMRAPVELLRQRGVPESDLVELDSARPEPLDVEAQIRAADPRHQDGLRVDEEEVVCATPLLPRHYPGNARFRRSRSQGAAPNTNRAAHDDSAARPKNATQREQRLDAESTDANR